MQDNNHILTRTEDGVLTIQFNRIDKKNAITKPMYAALYEAFDKASNDDGIKAILIRGDRGCFCAGNDISDLAGGMQDADVASGNFMFEMMNCKKPLVAAVSGPAVGIGLTLLLQCDLVYADDSAFFMTPFTALGVCPEAGSSFSLAQRVGYTKAAEMLLLSERIDAAKALQIGLINDIFPADTLYQKTQEITRRLAAFSAPSVRITKQLMHHFEATESRAAFDREIDGFKVLLESPEAKAAFEQFFKR